MYVAGQGFDNKHLFSVTFKFLALKRFFINNNLWEHFKQINSIYLCSDVF